MSQQNSELLAEKAQKTFSAERREDYVVLVIATITVILVLSGVIGVKFYSSLFFTY
jgi:hypothetical protein